MRIAVLDGHTLGADGNSWAALDRLGEVEVHDRRPIREGNPLRAARNCLITPHIAWATREARRRRRAATVANVASFLAGRPTNVVN